MWLEPSWNCLSQKLVQTYICPVTELSELRHVMRSPHFLPWEKGTAMLLYHGRLQERIDGNIYYVIYCRWYTLYPIRYSLRYRNITSSILYSQTHRDHLIPATISSFLLEVQWHLYHSEDSVRKYMWKYMWNYKIYRSMTYYFNISII